MPAIFINYRTGDGEKTALAIERELSHRFGEDLVFRASKSIKPGASSSQKLLEGVRRSGALVAVIGPGWVEAPDKRRPGARALDNKDDWVRKEILEAFRCGLPVVPVLDGRSTPRLDADALPRVLARLADCQSLRVDTQQGTSTLLHLGNELADILPEMGRADTYRTGSSDRTTSGDAVSSSMGDVRDQGTAVQARDVSGSIGGTVVNSPSGAVHTGSGDQYNDRSQRRQQNFSGENTTYVEGDNHGGIGHRYDRRGKDEEAR
ncbi:TIR domain-containing protein [Streptomyces phytohabitans]|uniref:TIR domain-containing protein n=1 Tax=Streptomyces phytohabitans TaxID=1150371 RepID=UPI00345C404D